MTPFELFDRGAATLVASWTEYARGAVGASVVRVPGADLAIFTQQPESLVYNNALLDLGLDDDARATVIGTMEEGYADAHVDRYAAWVHEGDSAMRADLDARRYVVTESTRAMGISLELFEAPRPELDLIHAAWPDYVALLGLDEDFQAYANPAAYVVRIACLDGGPAAVAMSYDHDGDCGIYNVTTLDHARGRGIGTALTAQLLHEARDRGCTTSTLQSTPMAERIYARLGFRDLGRYLEHTPGWAVI